MAIIIKLDDLLYDRRMTLTELADGNLVPAPVHLATVQWMAEMREVEVIAFGKSALIGMSALAGHVLYIEVIENGAVTVQPL